MSARVQRQLALALRSAKAARHHLYAAWSCGDALEGPMSKEHNRMCDAITRLRHLLVRFGGMPRHDGRKAASGE